jgi:hypothetical protein
LGNADVRILGNNTNLDILDNNLNSGLGHAIRMSDLALVPLGPSSGVEIHENNIEVFALTGLTVDPSGHTGTVDATCNWWNSSTGPTNPSNPGGSGEEVVGDADFTPWLVARAPGGACSGTGAPTPGKVTGGGQVQGDPAFSPLGDLISLPALVPSLTGGGSQATFGFTVKCCPPTGNLEYNDHGEGVRIKALSITGAVHQQSCDLLPGCAWEHARQVHRYRFGHPVGSDDHGAVQSGCR